MNRCRYMSVLTKCFLLLDVLTQNVAACVNLNNFILISVVVKAYLGVIVGEMGLGGHLNTSGQNVLRKIDYYLDTLSEKKKLICIKRSSCGFDIRQGSYQEP